MCIQDETALGLYHAIRSVHDLQLSNVDFEVDSKRIDDSFNVGSGYLTKFEAIMARSIQFCNLYFPVFYFVSYLL